jgi:phosphate starvation-inducible membrane PsiE
VKVYIYFDFFEFLMLDSKYARNDGHEPSKLGVEFCITIYGSMIKISTCEPENDFW